MVVFGKWTNKLEVKIYKEIKHTSVPKVVPENAPVYEIANTEGNGLTLIDNFTQNHGSSWITMRHTQNWADISVFYGIELT